MGGKHRGFLTTGEKGERSVLTGEYEPDELKQRWYDIRERSKLAFEDFRLILEHLPPTPRKRLFDRPELIRRADNPVALGHHTKFWGDLEGTVGLIYLGVEEAEEDAGEELVKGAMDRVARKRGQRVASFELNIEFADLPTEEEAIDNYIEWLEDGTIGLGDLHTDELAALLKANVDGLDQDAILDTYKARIRAAEAVKKSLERQRAEWLASKKARPDDDPD